MTNTPEYQKAKEEFNSVVNTRKIGFTEFAERLNGRAAMIGFVAAVGAYSVTGQILPGIF